MNETESANLLGDQSPGHFLIRISSSRAHEGVFVLAVKTRDSGVVQIQIEVSHQGRPTLIIFGRLFKLYNIQYIQYTVVQYILQMSLLPADATQQFL